MASHKTIKLERTAESTKDHPKNSIQHQRFRCYQTSSKDYHQKQALLKARGYAEKLGHDLYQS
jgi:uncharacterized LabA/DUF88 family protein